MKIYQVKRVLCELSSTVLPKQVLLRSRTADFRRENRLEHTD